MNMLNQMILEGNVVEDVVLNKTPFGVSTSTVKIATSRYYKNAEGKEVEEISFFDIDTFGTLAEVCKTHATKGRWMRVVGMLKQVVWTDGDGKKHSKISIIAEHIDFKPVK